MPDLYIDEVKKDGYIIENVRKIKDKEKCEEVVNRIISGWLKKDLTNEVEIW
jgi:pyruvoyl-dependent arginine decarboxylase (PvlArgDC)